MVTVILQGSEMELPDGYAEMIEQVAVAEVEFVPEAYAVYRCHGDEEYRAAAEAVIKAHTGFVGALNEFMWQRRLFAARAELDVELDLEGL